MDPLEDGAPVSAQPVKAMAMRIAQAALRSWFFIRLLSLNYLMLKLASGPGFPFTMICTL